MLCNTGNQNVSMVKQDLVCVYLSSIKNKTLFFFFHFSNRLHCSGTAQLQVDLMEVEVTTVSTSDT